jgi:hypothetical protein
MANKLLAGFAGLLAILGGVQAAEAAPIRWSGNGHYYDAITGAPNGINWYYASAAAQASTFMGVPGYLATLTSQEEDDFVASAFPTAAWEAYWLGGFQPTGSPEPDGGWQWVTGEAWAFTNWALGEPSNSDFGPTMPSEDGLQFYGLDPSRDGKWNDLYRERDSVFLGHVNGYVIEYPVPEPSQLCLLAAGGLALLWPGWKRWARPAA